MLSGTRREHTGDGAEHVHAPEHDHLPHEQYKETAGHGACQPCGAPAVSDCVLHTQHAGVNGFQKKLKNFCHLLILFVLLYIIKITKEAYDFSDS